MEFLNSKICPICNIVCINPRGLKRHIRTHYPGSTEKIIRCGYCSLVFTKPDNFSRHLRTQHGVTKDGTVIEPIKPVDVVPEGEQEFPCEICKEIFKNSTSLRLHFIRQHKLHPTGPNVELKKSEVDVSHPTTSSTRRSHVCKCGEEFLRDFDYRRHQTSVHKIDLEFLEHECADQSSFEEFQTSARLKYNVIFMEDEQPDGDPHPVFKCTKDSSCMAKLSVLEIDGRFFISGTITHTHYEEPPKASLPPKMPETKIGRPPKNPAKLPKKTSDKEALSLDLFKL